MLSATSFGRVSKNKQICRMKSAKLQKKIYLNYIKSKTNLFLQVNKLNILQKECRKELLELKHNG